MAPVGLKLFAFLVAAGLVLDIAVGTPFVLGAIKIVLACTLAFLVVPHWDRMAE